MLFRRNRRILQSEPFLQMITVICTQNNPRLCIYNPTAHLHALTTIQVSCIFNAVLFTALYYFCASISLFSPSTTSSLEHNPKETTFRIGMDATMAVFISSVIASFASSVEPPKKAVILSARDCPYSLVRSSENS